MRIEEYRDRIYRLTMDRMDGSKTYNIRTQFKSLGGWAKKYYSESAVLIRGKRDLDDVVSNFMTFVDQSLERILSYKDTTHEKDKEHENLIRFLKGSYQLATKRNALEKWEDYLVNISYDYSICTFISYMLLVGSEAYRNDTPIPEKACDPFQARSHAWFFTGKASIEHQRLAKYIFWMFKERDQENLRKLMTYTKEIGTIRDIFATEWMVGIADYCGYVNKNILGTRAKSKTSVDFVNLVDKKYPKLDSNFDYKDLKASTESNPVLYFMSKRTIEERSALLIELLKAKGNDGFVVDYISALLDKEREIQFKVNPYTKNYTGPDSYIQFMYENICRSGNMMLLKLFDECFSIKDKVRAPWSPLFTLDGYDSKFIKYNLDIGVDINREHGILGRQFALTKNFSGFLGYTAKADLLNYLVKERGLVIRDPGMYYLSAIENRDNRLLWYLFDCADIRCDNDLPLRAALFFSRTSVAEDIMEEYEDTNEAIQVLEDIVKLKDAPYDSKKTAQSILQLIRLDKFTPSSKKNSTNTGLIQFTS